MYSKEAFYGTSQVKSVNIYKSSIGGLNLFILLSFQRDKTQSFAQTSFADWKKARWSLYFDSIYHGVNAILFYYENEDSSELLITARHSLCLLNHFLNKQ